MLKMTKSPDMSGPKIKNGNSEVVRFGIRFDISGGSTSAIEIIKKSKKLKEENLFKSQKLAKSEKMSSKSRNLFNFNTKKNSLNLLISKAKVIFNRLWLAFTKTPILWHFNLECHIFIKTDILIYAISIVLN